MILAVLMACALILIYWVQNRPGATRSDWDGGAPVLVVVTAHLDADMAEASEYQSPRTWTISRRALEQVGAEAIGSRVQARLVGECRCQLMLRPPATVPPVLIGLVLVGLASTVPGLVARRRWRYRRELMARPSRPVTVTPTWLNRPLRPAVWGLRLTGGQRGDVVLAMVGTPLTWLPDGETVQLHGPDPRNGLCVLAAPGGVAVASTAPRRPSSPGLVAPWSDSLNLAAGLVAPPAERSVSIGGPGVSRISVSGQGPPMHHPPTETETVLAYGPTRLALAQNVAVGLAYLVSIVTALVTTSDLRGLATVVVVGGMGSATVARKLVAHSAAFKAPLRTWSDRRAAWAAAAAAHGAGLTPLARESTR